MKAALNAELKSVKTSREKARIWTSDYLERLVGEVGYQANLYKNNGPKWSVVTAILVSVYRDEIAKMKAIENFNLLQSANEGRETDDDEGEFD